MLALESLVKSYGAVRALGGVSLEIRRGETLALLGPSGCGKSTLLRVVAGLESPDTGRIRLEGRAITDLRPQKRGFGMVFQDYALFPHLNVEQNVGFGLVEQGWGRAESRKRTVELLELVGLVSYETRRVEQLSGGQQQRVALARALAPKPEVLLLDEPLSNLDLNLREHLQLELAEILASLSVTAIYVTHDQSEAFGLAERVALMQAGKVVQVATPSDLFARPASVWAARFLGHDNIYERERLGNLAASLDGPYALIRSDLVQLGHGELEAELRSRKVQGALHELELDLRQPALRLRWTGFSRELPTELAVGKALRLSVPAEALVGLTG